jgi:alcohol dehydrogenase
VPEPDPTFATRPRRARGAIRHYAGMLGPTATTALKLAGERNVRERVRRLATAGGDRARQRVRRTRPRMRALTAAPGGRLRWSSVPAPPAPGPRGALVHPIAVATCDIDPPLALGASPFPLPLHLGHECVAEVLAVGSSVTRVRPGQRVVVPFQISCGDCGPCRAGRSGNCASVPPISMYGFGLAGGHWGGALSDQLAVPYADAMLVPLPDGIDPAAAASVADTVCEGYRHVAPHLPVALDSDADTEVLVVGAVRRRTSFSASAALYAGLAAKALGARRVAVADAREHVRAHADRLGLAPLEPGELSGRPTAPLVAEVGGTAASLRAALAATAPDGVCSSAGGLHRSAQIPALLMYGRNATLHLGRSHVRSHIEPVLSLMADGKLHPEAVTTTLAPIDDAPAVLREHFARVGTKTILTA